MTSAREKTIQVNHQIRLKFLLEDILFKIKEPKLKLHTKKICCSKEVGAATKLAIEKTLFAVTEVIKQQQNKIQATIRQLQAEKTDD